MLHEQTGDTEATVAPMFGSRRMREPIPRWTLPVEEMPPDVAAQLIRDELSLDGTPLLNLASFVTTWMDDEAEELFSHAASKNFIDQDEYPHTAEIEHRCVNIIARLFGAQGADGTAVGTSTVGSSEAILLAGVALKRVWRHRQETADRPTDAPNLVLGTHVHVCWEKLCRYFEIEPRWVPLSPGRLHLDVDAAVAQVDENTIGVVGVLGNTYTGAFDDIAALNAALDDLHQSSGLDVGIHVDAASGGFVAPFSNPDLRWDFRLPRVRSINTSGHKYGLVYPGVGWALWRDRDALPDELLFHDNYLGNDQITFSLNFSKGAAQIIGQYYNLIRLGHEGYRSIVENLGTLASSVAKGFVDTGRFEILSEDGALPVVATKLAGDESFSAHDLAAHLRRRGWIVPAYTLPPQVDETSVLRVVVREGFSGDLAASLLADVDTALHELDASPPSGPTTAAFQRSHQRVC